jgi:hypothetical protein
MGGEAEPGARLDPQGSPDTQLRGRVAAVGIRKAATGAALGVGSDGTTIGSVSGGRSCEFAATALLLLGGPSGLFSAGSSAVASRGVTVFRSPRPVSRKPRSRRGDGPPTTHQEVTSRLAWGSRSEVSFGRTCADDQYAGHWGTSPRAAGTTQGTGGVRNVGIAKLASPLGRAIARSLCQGAGSGTTSAIAKGSGERQGRSQLISLRGAGRPQRSQNSPLVKAWPQMLWITHMGSTGSEGLV